MFLLRRFLHFCVHLRHPPLKYDRIFGFSLHRHWKSLNQALPAKFYADSVHSGWEFGAELKEYEEEHQASHHRHHNAAAG